MKTEDETNYMIHIFEDIQFAKFTISSLGSDHNLFQIDVACLYALHLLEIMHRLQNQM